MKILPGDIFPVGEFLLDEIKARNIKQEDLAKDLNISKSEMSLIINSKRNITIPIAFKLEDTLGIDAEFWMISQLKYKIEKYRKQI